MLVDIFAGTCKNIDIYKSMEGGILLNGGAGSGTGNLDLDIQHFPFDITAAPFDKTLSINYSKKVPTIKCVPVYSGTGYALFDYTYGNGYDEYYGATASGQGEFSDKDWPVNLQSGESKTASIFMPVTGYVFFWCSFSDVYVSMHGFYHYL